MLVQLFILKKAEIIIYHEKTPYFNYFFIEEKTKIINPCILTLNITNIDPINYFFIVSLQQKKLLVVDKYKLSSKLQDFNFNISEETDIQKSLNTIKKINKNYIIHTLLNNIQIKSIPFSKFFKFIPYNKK